MKFSHFLLFIVFHPSILVVFSQTTNPFEECFYVESSICINSKRAVIGKDNKPHNLLGLWTFDDKFAADHSGMKNFIQPAPKAGPAAGGKGYSAYFNGTDMSIIPHHNIYEKYEMTLSFWVFLLPGNMDGWRTLIYKGESSQEMTPSILLWPKDTRLHVRVTTDKLANEGLDSMSAIPLRKWTQITVTYSRQLLQLFINGMLDSQTILQGNLKVNKGPIYLGKDPYHAGTACYIDNLKFFDGKLRDSYLMAESFSPLYVTEGNYYTIIGCSSCNYNQALNSCPENYHLCSLPELYSGGYHTARALSWFKNNIEIWYRVTKETQSLQIAEQMLDPNAFKLGLCCII